MSPFVKPTTIPSGHNLALDRGLTGVSYTTQDPLPPHLPDNAQVVPPDTGQKSHLDALFPNNSLDDILLDFTKPSLANPELMSPFCFAEVLDSLPAYLEGMITQYDTETGRTITRALRLLKEQIRNRELLQMYRAALMQG